MNTFYEYMYCILLVQCVFTRIFGYSSFIRAVHYDYHFAPFTIIGVGGLSSNASAAAWWTRKRIGLYLPPLDLPSVQPYLSSVNW